jgi:transaldolase
MSPVPVPAWMEPRNRHRVGMSGPGTGAVRRGPAPLTRPGGLGAAVRQHDGHMESGDRLARLSDQGVSVWLDDMSRHRLSTGNLADLIAHKHVVGATSNPTIFAKAMSAEGPYDAQIRDLARRGIGLDEAVRLLTTYDIRWACDAFRPAYDASGGVDGRVSIEVAPGLAHDEEGSTAEAIGLAWLVDRPNVMIKIPATAEGIGAIRAATAAGINVNITLIFSLSRYDEVIEAYLSGLEQADAAGLDLASIYSVASFFVSRVDTAVDARLAKIGGPEADALRGQAAIANARLAYQRYEEVVASPRWQALEAKGAHRQRPLWASTGVKDPAYDDTRYVVELIAPDTVNTMPEPTIDAVADHGEISANSIAGTGEQSRATLDALEAIGVSYQEVVDALETEGVQKFDDAWAQLTESIRARLDAAR